LKRVFLHLAGAALLTACGSKHENVGATSLDVRQVCDQRATWTRAQTGDCGLCQEVAPSPSCGCPVVTGSSVSDAVAKCVSQAQAKGAEADCNGIDTCVDDCRGDCTCAENCYAGHDKCRPLASALDTCILQTCDARCR
jgi:hypothetical protein